MRLNKRALAVKLDVSERALTAWQGLGMPVLEHGRRGQSSYYDLAAVLNWIKATRDPTRVKIDIAALEREIGAAAPPSADICTHPGARAIARAIALARVAWFEDLSSWEFSVPACDMAELVALYIGALAAELGHMGCGDVAEELAAVESEDAWPETLEECIARASAEVPK